MDSLSPDQFTSKYRPSEYGRTWKQVGKSWDFHQAEGEDDIPSLNHKDLVRDLRENGMREPVQVYKGHVVDGHHRTVAAKDAGVPIHFEHAPSEMYEGQIGAYRGARRG